MQRWDKVIVLEWLTLLLSLGLCRLASLVTEAQPQHHHAALSDNPSCTMQQLFTQRLSERFSTRGFFWQGDFYNQLGPKKV